MAARRRRQPIIGSISTAGVYDITGIGWEQYRYARDIASRRQRPRLVVFQPDLRSRTDG